MSNKQISDYPSKNNCSAHYVDTAPIWNFWRNTRKYISHERNNCSSENNALLLLARIILQHDSQITCTHICLVSGICFVFQKHRRNIYFEFNCIYSSSWTVWTLWPSMLSHYDLNNDTINMPLQYGITQICDLQMHAKINHNLQLQTRARVKEEVKCITIVMHHMLYNIIK